MLPLRPTRVQQKESKKSVGMHGSPYISVAIPKGASKGGGIGLLAKRPMRPRDGNVEMMTPRR